MHRIESKIALVFPGVGSQHSAMAKSFYDNSQIARETFEEASDILKINMEDICFLKEFENKLNEIDISQLALLTACITIFRVFEKEIGLKPSYCLGHSLGEYSALCAGGVIKFSDALKIVQQRGRIIKETIASCDGTMIWAINIDNKIVKEICEEYSDSSSKVFISAYDSPTQCSISGNNSAIEKITQILENRGAIVYPLKMSGPFHSPLMINAANEMKSVLKGFKYSIPKCEVISNYSTIPYKDANSVIDNLSKQLISPIRWQESINYIAEKNVKYVIETGPKDVLKFLIKKISPILVPISFNNYKLCDQLRDNLYIKETDFQSIIEKCLKVAASTKNYNLDITEYQNRVVKPYLSVEGIYNNILKGEVTPSETQVIQSINMVLSVMETKKVSNRLRSEKLDYIFEGKFIKWS